MRICSKLHSEGHSQGKFGICESSISVNLVFPSSVFERGIFFLIGPFPDRSTCTFLWGNLSDTCTDIVANLLSAEENVLFEQGIPKYKKDKPL